jgi:DNA uptake protein ComE-like DNA-binding protein
MGWHVWTLQRGAARPTVLEASSSVDLNQADPALAEMPPHGGGKKTPPAEPLDVNEAGVAELMRLPHIGAAIAQRIVAARNERPFASVDDLRRVRGIGPKTLAGLRPHVRVGPPASGPLADRRPALP